MALQRPGIGGDVRVAAHQIRVREEWATFEHDSVQRSV